MTLGTTVHAALTSQHEGAAVLGNVLLLGWVVAPAGWAAGTVRQWGLVGHAQDEVDQAELPLSPGLLQPAQDVQGVATATLT